METIYADSLFLLNFVIDYFLLLCSARVCGSPLRRGRYAAAAALGALWAVLSLLPGAGFLSLAPMKLTLCALMCLTAFGGETRFFRHFAAFLAISAAFGWAVWGASMLSVGSYGDGLYVPVSLRMLAVSFAVCYAGIRLAFSRKGRMAEREAAELTIVFRDRSVSLRAIRDTGNDLHEPVSGRPAAVAEARSVAALFPEPAARALTLRSAPDAVAALASVPECTGRFSLIPYSAVGVEGGLLPVFRPDKTLVNGAEDRDLLIAVCPRPISPDGEYTAII